MEIQLWMSITVWVLCELQVYWSAGGAKNVFWPWLSLLRRWGSLTMIFLGILGFTKKYIRGHKWFTTRRVLKSHRSKMSIIYIYVIMKTMCPPTYDLNGFVVTHAFGNMMYGLCTQAHALSQNHCGDNWEGSICIHIYIYIYIIYIYIYIYV